METLVFCAIGALLCVGWFFLQMKVFEWADDKGTTLAWLISRASLLLLSTAITAVMFTAFITLYVMFVIPAFAG